MIAKANEVKTTRVALYGRVSTSEQVKGDSLQGQRDTLKKWAELEDWKVIESYFDEGKSGGTDQRPRLQDLLLDAKAGRFDLVVVAKLDRFFRNTRLLLNVIEQLKQYNVSFASKSEGLDTRKEGIGSVTLALLGSIAEWERKRIGERVSDFRTRRTAQGLWSSGKPLYGYTFDKTTKELLINDAEAEAVRFIFSEYTKKDTSIGILKLAQIMNDTNFPLLGDGRKNGNTYWSKPKIQHVLTHEAYQGGPNDKWKFKSPAIITTETWQEAQRRLKSNQHFKPSTMGRTEYQGRLVCGLCGRRLAIGFNGGNTRAYECPGRKQAYHLDGSPRCTLPRFDAKKLDKKITAKVNKMCNNPKLLTGYFEKYAENLKTEREALILRIQPLEAEANAIREDMTLLDAKLEMKRISPADYKTRMTVLQSKLAGIENRKTDLDPTTLQDLAVYDANLQFCETTLKLMNSLHAWQDDPTLTDEEKTQLDEIGQQNFKETFAALTDMIKTTDKETQKGSPLHINGIPDVLGDAFKYFIVYPDRIELKGNVTIAKSPATSAK